MMVIETLHGIARRFLLEPLVGDVRARQIAVFTGSVLILATAFSFIRCLKDALTIQLLLVGAMWVILTILFEVLIGRFALNLSWERILSDYDLRKGSLMPIGLLVMFLAPLVTAKMRGRSMA